MDEVVVDDLRELAPIDAVDVADSAAVLPGAAHAHFVAPRRQILEAVDAVDCLIRRLTDISPVLVRFDCCAADGFDPVAVPARQKCLRTCRIRKRQLHPFRHAADDTVGGLKHDACTAHAAAVVAVIEAVRQCHGQFNPPAIVSLHLMRRPRLRKLVVERLIGIAVRKVRDDRLIVRAEADVDLHILVILDGILVDANIADL